MGCGWRCKKSDGKPDAVSELRFFFGICSPRGGGEKQTIGKGIMGVWGGSVKDLSGTLSWGVVVVKSKMVRS